MEVLRKFVIASMFMWITPVVILYGFNHNLIPGLSRLSSHSATLLSGFVAVISVNLVVVFYVCMAMREAGDKHEPDPVFLFEALSSVNQSVAGEVGRDKRE